LIKKHAIRRTFKSKKNVEAARHKAPKIQRLVTETRLRRKRIQKEDKIKRWKRSITLTEEYKKVYDAWANKKRAAANDVKQQRKASKVDETKPVVVPSKTAPAKTATAKTAPIKAAPVKTAPVVAKVAEKAKAKK